MNVLKEAYNNERKINVWFKFHKHISLVCKTNLTSVFLIHKFCSSKTMNLNNKFYDNV